MRQLDLDFGQTDALSQRNECILCYNTDFADDASGCALCGYMPELLRTQTLIQLHLPLRENVVSRWCSSTG